MGSIESGLGSVPSHASNFSYDSVSDKSGTVFFERGDRFSNLGASHFCGLRCYRIETSQFIDNVPNKTDEIFMNIILHC